METRPRPAAERRKLRLLIAWIAALWGITAHAPYDRSDWLLENLLVFAAVALLGLTHRRFRFSLKSYALFTAFLSLHLIGAHYTYSQTPLGFWLQDALELSRNHYDRIVHFCFGFLLAVPFRELLTRVVGVRERWSYAMVVVTVLGMSGCYEATEGLVAMIVSPELGSAWLGTQGDEWDAQKDTALAALGATLTMSAAYWRGRRRRDAGLSRS
ncbi:MAG TPA: DUF2238 domain-containing protein [Gammaproteobacteria bacterium]|nr:DUF2238 domain-containing protein [Gammaproteobacteria bacterium]